MTDVMQGVRVLEVAEHTFVPAASALLADWGAEVIKIEHVERGDAMRGLMSSGVGIMSSDVHVLLEHSNRGKRSLGLDLSTPEGLEVLGRIAATCDVFLTNKLPSVRTKLSIDVDDIRRSNPDIIYVRGTGQGSRGPDADKGSYDVLSYWHRSGMALGVKQQDAATVPPPPAPAFGDSIGAMTIAGAIMGALFHRERTGEPTVVDVSLLGVGLWSMGAALALSLQLGIPWGPPPPGTSRNPLVATYRAADGTFVSFSCLQAARYWAEVCDIIGRPELATDERFADHASLSEHAGAAGDELAAAIAAHDADEWRKRLEEFSGQWTVVQDTLAAAEDPQTVANGYVVDCETSTGAPFRLAGAPVQYDERPPQARRAPEFNEHGDDILQEVGYDWDAIVAMKASGTVA
ncbi:CaiB/BaiF CoA transferase family protein [Dermatobacter hominis]|uniref:CaiB/BaiF CoA transferase family protein n=1 Tax=Dermatobacter hominis TaxID=2884263 RepID=UPI001D0FBF65|nr:CoA transferase [Dermatobacter hominis]UDY36663.1 CoA transferase [Dermatobacter hominis]